MVERSTSKPSLRDRILRVAAPIVFAGGMIGSGATLVDTVMKQSKIKATENAIAFLPPESSEQRDEAYKTIEIYNQDMERDLNYMLILGWVALAGTALIAHDRGRREKIQSLQSATS